MSHEELVEFFVAALPPFFAFPREYGPCMKFVKEIVEEKGFEMIGDLFFYEIPVEFDSVCSLYTCEELNNLKRIF